MHDYAVNDKCNAVDEMCVKGSADCAIKLTAQSYTIKKVSHNTTTKVLLSHCVVHYGEN